MVILLRNPARLTLSQLSKRLYSLKPGFRHLGFGNYVALSKAEKLYGKILSRRTFEKKLFHDRKYLAVILPHTDRIFIHPDSFMDMLRDILESRLKGVMSEINNIILESGAELSNYTLTPPA